MRKLTNSQMTILAERVTDLLEETHTNKYKELKESPEYKYFDRDFSDLLSNKLRELVTKAEDIKLLESALKSDLEKLEVEYPNLSYGWVGTPDKPQRALDNYLKTKKKEQFSEVDFNRDKTLRRVQADILLSDVDSPDELVKSLVEKLK